MPAGKPLPHKLDVEDLMIELTRRCNMSCDHCLRGDAMDVAMDPDLMDALLAQIGHVGQVVFTGGEPSLEIGLMRKFYELAAKHGVAVDSFYVATNGAANQPELALFLLERYAEACSPEACSVSLSADPYHEEPAGPSILKGLAFYDGQKEHGWDDPDGWVMPVGRAYLNGLGFGNSAILDYRSEDFSPEVLPDGSVAVSELYLSANGRVYPECNLSYEEIDAATDDPDACPCRSLPADSCAEALYRQAMDAGRIAS